jgi:acyl transferase domain-containing protein
MAPSPDDIAIIGISCRFPGANSPSKLWENLINSKDVQSEITRFNSKGFYKPDGGPRKGLTNVRHAYFIEEGVDRFDNAFFNISPLESEAMDPQQRILLEIAYETVENAGIRLEDFQGSDTAVFTG